MSAPLGRTAGRTAPWHQSNWDLRAAGNFVFGGAGTGLVVFAAIGYVFGAAYVMPALIGLALVGAGLLCVWAEIGRPLRAMNVYRHAKTSWMTRESFAAGLVFALGLAAVWLASQPLAQGAALAALVFAWVKGTISSKYSASALPIFSALAIRTAVSGDRFLLPLMRWSRV